MKDQTGYINNLTGNYIREMSNLKHLQPYMTSFELDFRKFECQSQSDQLSIILTPSIELIFEALETDDIEMYPSHSMLDPIFYRNFGNTFHHQNGPNQRQHTNKNTRKLYHHSTTRQQ